MSTTSPHRLVYTPSMLQSINTDQKMLLGGAGGSPFMAMQIIVNGTLSSPEKKCVQRRAI